MPMKKKWLGAAAALVTFALGPVGAAAAATTTPATTATTTTSTCTSGGSQVFKQFGDTSDYVLAPNGTFTGHASGWTLSGFASVVTDDDPFNLTPGTKYALELGPGAVAVSPPFCVSAANPSFRYLVEPLFLGDSANTLIQVAPNVASTAIGLVKTLYSYTNLSFLPGSWSASAPNPLATVIPLDQSGGTAMVRLEFVGVAGVYKVADIYVDPWAK